MINLFCGTVLAATVLALSGCGSENPAPAAAPAGDTASVCERWQTVQLPYLTSTAPEAKAYAKAVADSYQGVEAGNALELQRAFYSGWAEAVRPLVTQAEAPDLRAALTTQVAELDRRAAAARVDFAQQPFLAAQQLCLKKP